MEPTSLERFDCIVSGGGMVGMCQAVGLAQLGMRVALVEKHRLPAQLDPAFDGRVSAIALGSVRLLEAIGAWNAMRPHAEPILDIRVSDAGTPFFLHYAHQEVGEEPFGYIVENRYIRHALQQRAAALPNVIVLEHASIASFAADAGGISVDLRDGRALRASLLIGADGKQSELRRMAKIGALEWQYRQTAIVCTIQHEHPHHGLAQERFLSAGPFAVLPMTGKRSSLVWVEPEERLGIYMELPEAELVQEIRERVGDYLGEIGLAGPRFSYPLSLMHAKSYIAPRLALIGDAAHAIHPIAGQGVNLGFRDVAVLLELIAERHRLGLDSGDSTALARYQRWRRFDNVTMMAVTDGLNRLFSNHFAPIQWARDIGLWGVGQVPPLKRFLMRHAMGLVGDVPDLMVKKPL